MTSILSKPARLQATYPAHMRWENNRLVDSGQPQNPHFGAGGCILELSAQGTLVGLSHRPLLPMFSSFPLRRGADLFGTVLVTGRSYPAKSGTGSSPASVFTETRLEQQGHVGSAIAASLCALTQPVKTSRRSGQGQNRGAGDESGQGEFISGGGLSGRENPCTARAGGLRPINLSASPNHLNAGTLTQIAGSRHLSCQTKRPSPARKIQLAPKLLGVAAAFVEER